MAEKCWCEWCELPNSTPNILFSQREPTPATLTPKTLSSTANAFITFYFSDGSCCSRLIYGHLDIALDFNDSPIAASCVSKVFSRLKYSRFPYSYDVGAFNLGFQKTMLTLEPASTQFLAIGDIVTLEKLSGYHRVYLVMKSGTREGVRRVGRVVSGVDALERMISVEAENFTAVKAGAVEAVEK